MRAIGLGTCSTMARIGAILTPFVAQVLLRLSPYMAISIYGTVAFLAAIACLILPVETKGKLLTVRVFQLLLIKSLNILIIIVYLRRLNLNMM